MALWRPPEMEAQRPTCCGPWLRPSVGRQELALGVQLKPVVCTPECWDVRALPGSVDKGWVGPHGSGSATLPFPLAWGPEGEAAP